MKLSVISKEPFELDVVLVGLYEIRRLRNLKHEKVRDIFLFRLEHDELKLLPHRLRDLSSEKVRGIHIPLLAETR